MSNGRRPPWVIETAIEAKSATDAERLEGALQEISAANPTIGYSMDPGALAALVLATDEAQLDATLATLKRRCGGTVTVGSPQIRYRGALARTVDVDYTHKKLTASGGEFARVKLKIEPGGPGAGCAFRSQIVGRVVPDKFIGGVEQGVRSVCDSDALIGFPIDATVSLCDGAYHEIDSSWIAFEAAARSAMHKGATEAGVTLLEPIMDVAVEMPGDLAGAVLADMDRRGIRLQNVDTHGDGKAIRLDTITISLDTIVVWREKRGDAGVIRADAPLAHLLGYAEVLRSISDGRASCTMCFSRYAEAEGNDGPDDFTPAIGAERPS